MGRRVSEKTHHKTVEALDVSRGGITQPCLRSALTVCVYYINFLTAPDSQLHRLRFCFKNPCPITGLMDGGVSVTVELSVQWGHPSFRGLKEEVWEAGGTGSGVS